MNHASSVLGELDYTVRSGQPKKEKRRGDKKKPLEGGRERKRGERETGRERETERERKGEKRREKE